MIRVLRPLVLVSYGLLLVSAPALGAQLARASPESVGMSSQRLERLQGVVEEYIAQQQIAGAVTLIARRGKVVHELSLGKLDLESGTDLPRDAIFRIASMTKPITSVAAMMLVEEGQLLISDPVSKYLPEFERARVAVKNSSVPEGYTIEMARRPISVRNLLTHTAGISYGNGPARQLFEEERISGWYFAEQLEPIGSIIRRLAQLPFDAHPGELFLYGFSSDILGHLVEVVSGLELNQYFQQRIFEPLGMVDTHFYLPPEKLDRFTSVYTRTEKGLELIDGSVTSPYVTGPRMTFSGGAGLLSTVEDYARFLQMLLNGGELDGKRLLSPKTVQHMTTNHVVELFGDQGFGLGFAIVQDLGRELELGTPGSYGWGGAYFTAFWVDPTEQLFAIMMSQLIPNQSSDLRSKFRNLVYQAIVESYVGDPD